MTDIGEAKKDIKEVVLVMSVMSLPTDIIIHHHYIIIMEVKNIERETQDWKSYRFEAITGTDVGKILGCDSCCSKRKLFESKIQRVDVCENASEITKAFLSLGRKYESLALSDFLNTDIGESLGHGFVPTICQHKTISYFAGTPDYLYPEDSVLIEIKTHFYPTPNQANPISFPKSIPLKYYLQVQSYLEIMNFDEGYLWSWTLNNGANLFWIKRDKDLFNDIISEKLERFYDSLTHAKEVGIESKAYLDILKTMKSKPGENSENQRVVEKSMNTHTLFNGHHTPKYRKLN